MRKTALFTRIVAFAIALTFLASALPETVQAASSNLADVPVVPVQPDNVSRNFGGACQPKVQSLNDSWTVMTEPFRDFESSVLLDLLSAGQLPFSLESAGVPQVECITGDSCHHGQDDCECDREYIGCWDAHLDQECSAKKIAKCSVHALNPGRLAACLASAGATCWIPAGCSGWKWRCTKICR